MAPNNSGEKKYSDLFDFFRERKWKYLSGIGFILGVNILQLVIPRITGDAIDLIQARNIDGRGLFHYSLVIVLVSLLVFLLNYLSRVQIMGASILYEMLLRNRMFKHLESLSMNFFNKKGVGEIMALSVNDVGAVRNALGRGITLIADTTFLLLFSITVMSRTIDMRLTLVAFIPFPILIFIMAKFGLIINKRFRKVQESFADLTRKAQENISGIRVVKAFAQEDFEMANFKELNEKNYRINMHLVRVWGLFFPLIAFVSSLSYLILLSYGGLLVIRKGITLGDFIAFNSYIGLLVRPVRNIGTLVNVIQRGAASKDRIQELFYIKPDIYDRNSAESTGETHIPPEIKGRIEFSHLTFSYSGSSRSVLKDINITVEPGKTLGIIGRVGSGKSTLANLLLRLYNPEGERQILIDGTDIMDIPLETLRSSIGYVPQDNLLFSSPLKDNIAFSPREYTMDKVEEAAVISQVYDDIMEFPEKFDTYLGERGVNISGGQKQRISIARALIKDPSILILDDCLSAVDTKTERRIMDGLKVFMRNRTCIIIAHRISTIKDADEIIVLEKGRIVERGTHDELVALKGSYDKMYQRQLLEDKVVNA